MSWTTTGNVPSDWCQQFSKGYWAIPWKGRRGKDIQYASQQISPTGQNNWTTEEEAMAVV